MDKGHKLQNTSLSEKIKNFQILIPVNSEGISLRYSTNLFVTFNINKYPKRSQLKVASF